MLEVKRGHNLFYTQIFHLLVLQGEQKQHIGRTLPAQTNTSFLSMYWIIIFELSDIGMRINIQAVSNPTGE
jgi:hypothetical protein